MDGELIDRALRAYCEAVNLAEPLRALLAGAWSRTRSRDVLFHSISAGRPVDREPPYAPPAPPATISGPADRLEHLRVRAGKRLPEVPLIFHSAETPLNGRSA